MKNDEFPSKGLRVYIIMASCIIISRGLGILMEVSRSIMFIGIFIVILILAFVFYNLYKRKLWPWKINLIIICIVTFLIPLKRTNNTFELLIYMFVCILIWLTPCLVFFKKHKEFFY